METFFTSCCNIRLFSVYVMLKWAHNSLFYQVNSFTSSENDNNSSWTCCQSPPKALSLPWHIAFLNMFANNFNQNVFLSYSSNVAWDMSLNSTPILVYLYQRYLWKCSLSRRQELSLLLSVTRIKLYTSQLDLDKYLMNWMNSVLFQ